jgi:hypothetical protein
MLDSIERRGWMPRFYFSHYHIMAAAFFARETAQIEDEHRDKESISSEVFCRHRAYVTGCLFSAVSFLEGQINEIFMDAAEDQRNYIHGLGDKIFLLAEMWNLGVPRTASYSILRKYEILLTLAEKPPLDRGDVIYQDVKLLIWLRNALIHYEPISSTSTAPTSQEQEQKFRGKFALNPLTGSKTPFFPERCLSHGCAKWAVRSSIEFVDECCLRLGIEPVFNTVRTSLTV